MAPAGGKRSQPAGVVGPIEQGGVVALALDLDDEREPLVQEVDAADPVVVAQVDLAPVGAQAMRAHELGEA